MFVSYLSGYIQKNMGSIAREITRLIDDKHMEILFVCRRTAAIDLRYSLSIDLTAIIKCKVFRMNYSYLCIFVSFEI